LKDRSASSNAPLSGSCKASREPNRGEAHVMHDGDVREWIPARSTAGGAADGSVQERPAGRRCRRAGMARAAVGSASGADQR
jgi:hypothetical protein